jgi:hypothetical protein
MRSHPQKIGINGLSKEDKKKVLRKWGAGKHRIKANDFLRPKRK